jgi:hypothetical protein
MAHAGDRGGTRDGRAARIVGPALAVLFAIAGGGCGGDDAEDDDCRHARRCDTGGDVCTHLDERCTCGPNLSWECEPEQCAVGPEPEGAACPLVGLQCDAGFENPGSRCIGPEQVWATCRYYAEGLFPSGCLPAAPTVGAPCCQGITGAGLSGCPYGDARYDCVDDHWVLLAPP